MSQTNTETKRPVQRDEMSKFAWTWKEMKKNKTAYFMLAPFFILFIVFTVLPVFLSILLSLTDFNMLQFPPHWMGLSNFTRLFLEDDIFMLACQNTLVFASVTGPVSYLLSLLIAWFINELPPKVRLPYLENPLLVRLLRMGKRNSYGPRNYIYSYSVVLECGIRNASLYRSCSLDLSRYGIPFLHRRLPDHRQIDVRGCCG